jgi:flagellar L-ring protein precursor FlgH
MVTILSLAATACGGSLWAKAERRTTGRSLYADDKAAILGDVLTIKIAEGSTIETKKKRNTEKKSSLDGKGSGQFEFGDIATQLERFGFGKPFTMPTWNYEGKANDKLEGKADWTSSAKYIDQITVVVEDVMPNGNLLVLGKRTREVTGNRQVIQASGIVRPSDISAGNVIDSTRVANFHVVYHNQGFEMNSTRPGWMHRVWNLLNPF